MNIKVQHHSLAGQTGAVASKSYAHRLLICAALSDRETTLGVPERSADIDATADCLRALGAGVEYSDGKFTVEPVRYKARSPELNCGESGSTLRFLLPVAAAVSENASFTGSGRLPERPIGELIDALQKGGVTFSARRLPFTLGGKLRGGVFTLPGDVSSQYISGLLLALPEVGGGQIRLTSKLQSAGYVKMTVYTMARFGVAVTGRDGAYIVHPEARYTSPGVIDAEGDWSNAAFFLAAGAIGGDVTVTGLEPKSVQGDRKIVEILRRFGADVTVCDGAVTARQSPLQGCDVDIRDIPDLLPILAVTAAFANGESRFTGGERLRMKESDRLRSVSEMITALGGDVTELPDGLVVRGKALRGGTVQSRNDHRIVMSAAVAGAMCSGDVTIIGADAARKSYPAFFEDFRKIGGIADVV